MSPLDAPAGLSTRLASAADADDLADLINQVNVAEVGFPWTNADEIRDDLTSPGRDPENDVLLVADDGTTVGYLTMSVDPESPTEWHHFAFVRPSAWGHGLSTWLLQVGEGRARAAVGAAPGSGAATVRVSRWSTNQAAGSLFERLGYMRVRTFREMRIELVDLPAAPIVPDGIVIRPFIRDRDARPAHATLAEAFEDHWGQAFDPFDQWIHRFVDGEGSGFDPGLWFVALDGEEIVGAICCRERTPRSPDAASVDVLGVRRPWRGRGIGRALLLTAFVAVHIRGGEAVELGVDAANPSGATRLYEDVGMRELHSFEIWEKSLR